MISEYHFENVFSMQLVCKDDIDEKRKDEEDNVNQ